MAFSEFEIKLHEREVEAFVESRRPPPSLRDEVDIGFRIENQSVVIFEVRPAWRDPSKTTESGIAKATYVKKRDVWKVLWMRADLQWHGYTPAKYVDTLAEFLEIVDRDEHGAFFG